MPEKGRIHLVSKPKAEASFRCASACQRTSSGRYRRSLHSASGAVRSLTPLLLRKPLGFHPNPRHGFHPCTLTRTFSPGPFFFDCLWHSYAVLFSKDRLYRHGLLPFAKLNYRHPPVPVLRRAITAVIASRSEPPIIHAHCQGRALSPVCGLAPANIAAVAARPGAYRTYRNGDFTERVPTKIPSACDVQTAALEPPENLDA